MDWKQILSLYDENLTDERKEEIYNELVKDQKFDSKIAKKLFPLCLNILKYKGQQVEKQRDEIEMLASSDIDLKSTLEQMEKQKKMLSKYEAERSQFKARIKELTDEIALIHGRDLQGSDEDSPDQLSEIDKQQELMAKISSKNKHIKRLLRDIEKHEHEAASYLNVIKSMKMNFEQANEKIAHLDTQLTEVTESNKSIEEKFTELANQQLELEQENQQLQKDRNEKEQEIQIFSAQVEERVTIYKAVLDEKQREIDALKDRYETLIEQVPGMDVDGVEIENKRLIDSSKEKDELINTFDAKLQQLTAELMDSTETIKKLAEEREELREKLLRNRSDKCCEETRNLLERSNERNMELQEMLEAADDENMLKSKQAFEAIEILKSYENSTDGLADALKKIHQLQETVHQRDKQIKELVVDVNAQNEVVAENSVLRRRLGISDDEMVETKAFLAKQKRYAKINDRLTLKLRASEEMRLQLKLDKHDLKRRITQLEARLSGGEEDDDLNQSRTTSECSDAYKFKSTAAAKRESHRVEMKQCENCSVTYNVYESLKYCRNCIMSQNLCGNCTSNFKVTSTENIELIKKIAKLEVDHQSIVEENENLRSGLNEILEKLRDSEGSSSVHTIVNKATLEKLLHILKLGSIMKASEQAAEANEVKITASSIDESSKIETQNEISQLKLLIKNLSEENETIKLDLDKMNRLQTMYEELVRSSELSDDDKHRLLVKSLERCHEFEMNLKSYERKIDFLMNENDNLHREMRLFKASSFELMNDMKMEIFGKTEEMLAIDSHDDNEISIVEDELQRLRMELNGLCFNVLKNIKSLDQDNLIESIDKEQLSNVTIIENNNLSTTFITRTELDALKSKLAKMQKTINAHEIREKQIEELTKITQHQLKSQQLMLSKISEDEVIARHLIVDLQSQSNDNYLLTKTTRDLVAAKESEDHTRLENDKLKSEVLILEEKLLKAHQALDEKKREWNDCENGNLLKIQYLKKSLLDLCNNYSTMTPIYLIADFIKNYSSLLEAKKQFELSKMSSQSMPEVSHDSLVAQLKEMSLTDIEAKIEIIKYKSTCDYLKQQLETHESTISELHNEIARIKSNEIKMTQHWDSIRMLFSTTTKDNHIEIVAEKLKHDKGVQAGVVTKDCDTNTDVVQQQQVPQVATQLAIDIQQQQPIPAALQQQQPAMQAAVQQKTEDQNSLQIKLTTALSLASTRSSLLIESENRLSEAQGRIKVLEKSLENLRSLENERKQQQQQQQETQSEKSHVKDDHIMNITISSLQSLILDKDTNISRYQEMLRNEREKNIRTFDETSEQIKQLKKVIDTHETTIDERNKSIEKLKATMSELNDKLQAALRPASPVPSSQLSMFAKSDREDMEIKLKDAHTEIKSMEQQNNDLTNTVKLLQKTVSEKDISVKELSIKLKASSDNLEALSENFTSASPEIDGLRDMLEEKDKHIQDLTETLSQFHDDQQKFITDSAFNSVEQVTILSNNLAREQTKTRVLATQVEAQRREIGNFQMQLRSQRELVKTYKIQLIQRPVISVKSDRSSSSSREDHQAKRITELEHALEQAKDDLRRQTNINENKKAKNAAELGLWDKQKRYQEISEKLKAKLTDKEIDNERTKANLQMARNSIKRLENEKIMLENKLKSKQYIQQFPDSTQCRLCREKRQKQPDDISSINSAFTDKYDGGHEENTYDMIKSLQARVESQQRRIVTYELDKKGPSAVAMEYEKIHEQLLRAEAKVVRLECTNAQLQVEIDLAFQNNQGRSQETKLKYLEDYILVLKEELAQARIASSPVLAKSKFNDDQTRIHDLEQTILKLKLIVEKYHAENKHLKNTKTRPSTGGSAPPTCSYMSASDRKKEELFEKLRTDYDKLQNSYDQLQCNYNKVLEQTNNPDFSNTKMNEAFLKLNNEYSALSTDYAKLENEYERLKKSFDELLKQNSRLEVDLEFAQIENSQAIGASCPHCNQKTSHTGQSLEEMIRKVDEKEAMLDRAKVCLSRAHHKEKQMRRHISDQGKRIRELEGYPVISEENSETNYP